MKGIRRQAYKERKASENESQKLEEVGEALEYSVLLAPHVFPTRAYMPFLREYMPGLTCVIPGESQVVIVIPEKDSSTLACQEVSTSVMGAVSETVKLPGP